MQDLDTMTNVILNNEYKLHEEEQKGSFCVAFPWKPKIC